jgi:hypothetical protein
LFKRRIAFKLFSSNSRDKMSSENSTLSLKEAHNGG